LRRLGGILAARQAQSLQPVRLEGSPAELNPMVEALNGLLQRIGTLVAAERRFTADAAHELRTPIAAIRTQAQVALNEGDGALRRHALQSALEGCDRATRLVEQLLTLSRLDSEATATWPAADLAAVARQVLADMAPRAVAKGQVLELEADEHCTVATDGTLLAVLVRNLVDNAVRYSPAQAQVKVTLSHDASRTWLRVEDSGPGLSEPDLQRLGERFFRVLGSGQGGCGLGWSIVRRIAAVHRAEVRASRSVALGGLQVVVEWPAL